MKTRFLSGCLALTFAAGCTISGPQPAIRPEAPAASAAPQVKPGEKTRQKIAASIRAGRSQAALALIRAERERNRTAFTEEYLRALQSLAATADRHFEKNEVEAAGTALRTLLDHFPEDAAVASRFGRSRPEIETRLETCADRLMGDGLARYRSGDLAGAIGTWKRILVFHSRHEGARKIIHTADNQLKKLRSLP